MSATLGELFEPKDEELLEGSEPTEELSLIEKMLKGEEDKDINDDLSNFVEDED